MFRVVRRKLACLGVSLALFAGIFSQFAAPLHQMLSVHRICPEHGDLVEDSGSIVSAPSAAPGQSEVSSGNEAGLNPGHADEHCALCAQRGSLNSVLSFLTATGEPVAEYPRVPICPAHESVALLRLAPKSSPPA
jgi:hypothetical protein